MKTRISFAPSALSIVASVLVLLAVFMFLGYMVGKAAFYMLN